MTAQKFFTHPLGIIIAASGATFLWGSAFPFIKLSYAELHIGQDETFEQLLFAGYRFVLAALLIIGFTLVIGKSPAFQKGTGKGLFKVGLFQTFFQYLFFYIGLSHSSGIQGSIIAGTTSFFQIMIAHFMYKNDALSFRKGIGLLVGFLGVVIVNMTKGSLQLQFGWGELCLLIAMFCGGLGNVLAKNETSKIDVLYLTSYQMLIGGLGLTLIGVVQAGWMPFHWSALSSLVFIYLAFLSAAGFVLWNNVMKFNKVGSISMYLFLIPVFGVFLSVIILNEKLHSMIFLALALVVSGIIIVNRHKEDKASDLQGQTPV